MDTVNVGTQVSGDISKIYVDFNSKVKKGQVIAELDRSKLQTALYQTKIAASSAKVDYEHKLSVYNRTKKAFRIGKRERCRSGNGGIRNERGKTCLGNPEKRGQPGGTEPELLHHQESNRRRGAGTLCRCRADCRRFDERTDPLYFGEGPFENAGHGERR